MKYSFAHSLRINRGRLGLPVLLLLAAPIPVHAQGTVETWVNHQGTSFPLKGNPSNAGFSQVSAGFMHSLALHRDASITSWGPPNFYAVSRSPAGNDFRYVEAGDFFSIALRTNGSVYAWGPPQNPVVQNLPSVTGLVQVAAGANHAVALHTDGSLFSWGRDDAGVVSTTPTQADFIQVDAGATYSVALRADGSIVAWGKDNLGTVTGIPTGTGFIQVAAARGYGLALRADGSIQYWGPPYGEVYDYMPSTSGFTQLAVSDYFCFALTAAGTIRMWGDKNAPGSFSIGTGITHVAAGGAHGVSLLDNGAGYGSCFGDGSGAACPCGGSGGAGRGCPNSGTLSGARLQGYGSANLSGSVFRLEATGVPSNRPGLILKGSDQLGGGLGNPVGDGLLCIGGQTARSHVLTASQWGYMAFTDFAGSSFASTSNGLGVPTNYQLWYRDPGYTCSGAAFNFSNAWIVHWMP